MATRKKDEFAVCCQNGKIKLEELGPYPDEIKRLLLGTDRLARNFHDNIRSYNNALAFASLGAKLDTPSGRGPYCFKIHGQIYHRIGGLHPEPNHHPTYGQLYILDSGIALQERMSKTANQGCLETILRRLDQIIRSINRFAESYQLMCEVEKVEIERAKNENRDAHEYMMVFDMDRRLDRRRYNIPRANESAAIIVGNVGSGDIPLHEIAVHPRQGQLTTIPVTSAECDPMTYPLLFPRGEPGWHPNMKDALGVRNISIRQFYAFRIAQRLNSFNPILYSGKLFQQYLVDAYVKVEQTRLDYQRFNQKQLRVDSYKGLSDYLAYAAEQRQLPPGKVVILSSCFPGSPRAMVQNYQDAMAICRKYGKPDIFITFTCNPAWKEITRELSPGQIPSDRPDIVGKVFKVKLKNMLDDLLCKNVLGKVTAYTWVIEFQKRGLPHCHMLLMLDESDKPRDPQAIDRIVQAEIPSQTDYPRLYRYMVLYMVS